MFSSHLNIFIIAFKANCALSPFFCYACHWSRVYNNNIQQHCHHCLHQSLGLLVQKSLQSLIKELSSSLAISCGSVTTRSIGKVYFSHITTVAGQ